MGTAVLAENMERVMQFLRTKKPELASNEKLSKRAGVSSNTVGRMRRGDGSVAIGTLDSVAKVAGFTAAQLLTQGFDPLNPPELVSSAAEKQMLKLFRERESPPEDSRRPLSIRHEGQADNIGRTKRSSRG